MNTLHIITRRDLTEGRRAAQVVHVAMRWAARFGDTHATVHIHAVPARIELEFVCHGLRGNAHARLVEFREPDLSDQLTALMTDQPVDLPLL